MKSMIEYARTEYPDHEIQVWSPGGTTNVGGDLLLRDHTVVANVIGAEATRNLARQMYHAGWSSTVALLVMPNEPKVIADEPVDTEGVADLPNRRVIAASIVGGLVGALIGALIGAWVAGGGAAVITAGFGAILGAVVGGMIGGFGRHAGNRAWSQPNAPGRTMGLVVARTHDEAEATRAAHEMETAEPHDVRILSAGGAWHAPLT